MAQFVLGPLEPLLVIGLQLRPGTIDVEGKHRHGGSIRVGLAPVAVLRRFLQRRGDALRVLQLEHALLQVHGVALVGDLLRPAVCGRAGHGVLLEVRQTNALPRQSAAPPPRRL